jgi:hypothetical protein
MAQNIGLRSFLRLQGQPAVSGADQRTPSSHRQLLVIVNNYFIMH